MVNNTIWESASRPLFVRSVWLETAKSARAPQRHFILDYETQRKLQEQRSFAYYSCNQYNRKRKESFRQTVSYDISEIEQSRASCSTPETNKELLTVASSKLKLKPPAMATQTQIPKHKPHKRTGLRRLTKQNLEKLEDYSGHSYRSRQSINSTFTALEVPAVSKRLAERVLNWLDLAVKTVVTENNELDLEIPDNDSPSAQRCATAKLSENVNAKMQKHCAYKRWRNEEKSRQQATNTMNVAVEAQHGQADAVKCVSIVFERQHANNAQTVSTIEIPGREKKIVNLERLNKSADMRRLVRPPISVLDNLAKSAHENVIVLDSEKRNSSMAKKLCPQKILQDTRKQLHIFLPSLPDKSNTLELCRTSTVDSVSALSTSGN